MADQSAEILDVLRRARQRITPPGAWCQGALHRLSDGREADSARDACSFCGYGALDAETRDPVIWALAACDLDKIARMHFPAWQDAPHRTQAEVIAAFDEAIEKRRAQNPKEETP